MTKSIKILIAGSVNINTLDVIVTNAIDNIIAKNHIIHIGNISNLDTLVQKYLMDKNYNNVVVHCIDNSYSNYINNHWTIKNHESAEFLNDYEMHECFSSQITDDVDTGFIVHDGNDDYIYRTILRLCVADKYIEVFRHDYNTLEIYNQNAKLKFN